MDAMLVLSRPHASVRLLQLEFECTFPAVAAKLSKLCRPSNQKIHYLDHHPSPPPHIHPWTASLSIGGRSVACCGLL